MPRPFVDNYWQVYVGNRGSGMQLLKKKRPFVRGFQHQFHDMSLSQRHDHFDTDSTSVSDTFGKLRSILGIPMQSICLICCSAIVLPRVSFYIVFANDYQPHAEQRDSLKKDLKWAHRFNRNKSGCSV